MTIMSPLRACLFCSPSPPTSSSRWAAAPDTPARNASSPAVFRKIHQQISKTPSSMLTETSNAGATARNSRTFAHTAAFKSP